MNYSFHFLIAFSLVLFHSFIYAQNAPCKSYTYGDAAITLIGSKEHPDLCGKVLKVFRKDSITYYKEIEYPAGTDNGFFVPDEHIVRAYFVMLKKGNNDGKTVLIDRQGNVFDLPGGKYFIYKPLGLLFSRQNKRFAVFDLTMEKLIYDSQTSGGSGELYGDITFYSFNQNIYIKAESDPAMGKDYSREALYKFNFEKNSLERITNADGLRLNEIPLAPDSVEKEGCSCN